jgi:hypothetical protein
LAPRIPYTLGSETETQTKKPATAKNNTLQWDVKQRKQKGGIINVRKQKRKEKEENEKQRKAKKAECIPMAVTCAQKTGAALSIVEVII